MKEDFTILKSINEEKIFYAGIILFNPENYLFIKSIRVLLTLGVKVVIFDNSTIQKNLVLNKKILFDEFGDLVILLQSAKGNVGLGYPFNEIVKISLKEKNSKGIFFFDQDSEVNKEAVLYLEESFNKLSVQKSFGIIAALPMKKEGGSYRIRKRRVSLDSNLDSNLVEVQQVSSSFSLIPITTFQKIGFFYEDFFIDHIDMDFSMRCWKNNLPIYIDTRARFTHQIGLGNVVVCNKFLFPYSDEYRHYYQVRNLILSLKRNNDTYFTILKEVCLRLMIVIIISLYTGSAYKRLYFLLKGIIDGYNNKSGKLILK